MTPVYIITVMVLLININKFSVEARVSPLIWGQTWSGSWILGRSWDSAHNYGPGEHCDPPPGTICESDSICRAHADQGAPATLSQS